MIPNPHKTEKQGLAPHTYSPTSQVQNSWSKTMGYHIITGPQTPKIMKISTINSWSPTLGDGQHSKPGKGNPMEGIYDVYVWWLSLILLCIGGMTIISGYNQA